MDSWFNNSVFWVYCLAVILIAFIIFLIIAPSFNNPNSWYIFLNLPWLGYQKWLILIVWLIVYILIIIAGYLADVHSYGQVQQFIRILFGFQLILNFLWVVLFFGIHNLEAAFYANLVFVIINIFIVIAYTQVYIASGWLYYFYLLWSIILLSYTHYTWKHNLKHPSIDNEI